LFTNRVRAISKTVSTNSQHYSAALTERARTLRENVRENVGNVRENVRENVSNPPVAFTNRVRGIRKSVSNPHHYPAAVLAIAAVAVGVAPLTATAATTSASAKPAAVAAPQAGAAQSSSTSSGTSAAAPSTTSSPSASSSSSTPAPAQTTQTTQAASTPSAPYAGTNYSQLEPTGTVGSQSSITLDSSQWANATTIVNAANNLHLSPYAATIAVATSMQESKLQNLTVAVDHDSLGLFQQRPSTGWGTPSELEDPTYAATAFLKSLPSNYESMPLDNAAQQVQRSFDGYLYAQWENQAAHIVYTIANG
jgi:hypothetical protein